MRCLGKRVLFYILVACCAVGITQRSLAQNARPMVEKYLLNGQLAKGEADLMRHLKQNPGDDQARFGLGALQFLQAVERLGQGWYNYGLFNADEEILRVVPLTRLPIPPNPKADKLTYARMRKIYENFLADLKKAEATLAKVKDKDVEMPLHFGLIRLDLDGDGKTGEKESLWKMYQGLNVQSGVSKEVAQRFVINFDKGDVHWLRGYCHLLMATNEVLLAYDWKRPFDHVARLTNKKLNKLDFEDQITEIIALIHLLRLDVIEPNRMTAAHKHLHGMIRQSLQSWKAIEAETDNNREWVPNANQQSVIPNVRVTQDMIDGWKEVMGEARAILDGKKLIPHWRIKDGRGVNLKKVFTNPQEFDLVMWVHGGGLEPFLEKGPMTQPQFWDRMFRVFRGEFVGFALFFN